MAGFSDYLEDKVLDHVLTASKAVASGDVFRFDAGDLDVTLA